MLTEFEGTFNARGLCSFRENSEARSRRCQPAMRLGLVSFWAVLEPKCAIEILDELRAGGHTRALRLLEEFAVSFGTQWE